jgi:hypothetical protein
MNGQNSRFWARFLVLAFCACPVAAAASLVQIDISSLVNADLTTYTHGYGYPQDGGPLSVAGIPFTLATISPSGHTAVIQASGSAPQTFSIPVNLSGVVTVDTLIDSAFPFDTGSCGTTIGELDFVGVTSSPFVYTLTEGINVRDHYNGSFCNTVTDVAGTANFSGNVRLDMQRITLPPSFASDVLVRIDFKGYGEGDHGTPFVAALTANSIAAPAPALSPAALLALGLLLGAGGWLSLRRRARE